MIGFAVNTCFQCLFHYSKVLHGDEYLSNRQFRLDRKRTLNRVLNSCMTESSTTDQSCCMTHGLSTIILCPSFLTAHLNTKASLLDVTIGRPGIELSPAKW